MFKAILGRIMEGRLRAPKKVEMKESTTGAKEFRHLAIRINPVHFGALSNRFSCSGLSQSRLRKHERDAWRK